MGVSFFHLHSTVIIYDTPNFIAIYFGTQSTVIKNDKKIGDKPEWHLATIKEGNRIHIVQYSHSVKRLKRKSIQTKTVKMKLIIVILGVFLVLGELKLRRNLLFP